MSDPNQGFEPPPPPPPFNPQPDPPKIAGLRPDKLRIPAVVMFVLGLIMGVAGIAKILPGGIGTGLAFAVWGILLFAFSFIRLPQIIGTDEPPMSAFEKLAGIFYAPTRVFKNLRAHPTWLAPLLVLGVFSGVYSAAFVQRLTPERLVDHTFEKLADSPFKPPPDKMEQAKQEALQAAKQPVQRVQSFAKGFFVVFLFATLAAGLSLLVVLAFGGRINFWQALATVLYGYVPIIVITKVVSLIILYVKAPEDVHPILNAESLLQDNLGILFNPAEHPALFVLGSVIGILSFYGLWLRAKGLQHSGTKVSSSTAWGASITLWVLALIFGMIFATLFSSFMT